MSVEIICGKCGKLVQKIKMLKSIKDTLDVYDGKCPSCGQKLSIQEFSLDIQKKDNQ